MNIENLGELKVVPVLDQSESLSGIRADAISLRAMETIIFSVQTLAENRSTEGLLDGGLALGPAEIYNLREFMWDSTADAGQNADKLGFLDAAAASKTANYIELLHATPRNKRLLKKFNPPLVVPDPPALATQEVKFGRIVHNRKVMKAKTDHEAAMLRWYEDTESRERAQLQKELTTSRGYEASVAINALIRQYE